jgi:hypothetical protein
MSRGAPSAPITISKMTLPLSDTPAGRSGSTRFIATGRETLPPARTGSVGQAAALGDEGDEPHAKHTNARSAVHERRTIANLLRILRRPTFCCSAAAAER